MPNLGVTELLIILVIAVMIFGVGRLPEVGGAVGKTIREFRSNMNSSRKDSSPLDEDDDDVVEVAEEEAREKSA